MFPKNLFLKQAEGRIESLGHSWSPALRAQGQGVCPEMLEVRAENIMASGMATSQGVLISKRISSDLGVLTTQGPVSQANE